MSSYRGSTHEVARNFVDLLENRDLAIVAVRHAPDSTHIVIFLDPGVDGRQQAMTIEIPDTLNGGTTILHPAVPIDHQPSL